MASILINDFTELGITMLIINIDRQLPGLLLFISVYILFQRIYFVLCYNIQVKCLNFPYEISRIIKFLFHFLCPKIIQKVPRKEFNCIIMERVTFSFTINAHY